MIREEFQVHLLNDKGIAAAELLAQEFSRLLGICEAACGSTSREFAIVRTKLQEASFFAKRGIAIQPENQK